MGIDKISLIFSFVATLISVYVYADSTYKKRLKNRILFYIYEFYSPTYMINKIPTTKMIYDKIGLKLNRKKDIVACLLDLSKEEKIIAVTDLSSPFEEIHWKPNMKFQK